MKDTAAILDILERTYPDAKCSLNFTNPLELLVATVLSAQCTDERVNQVTESLFNKYRSAQDYAGVPLQELEEDIRPTGFFRNKAKSLKRCGASLVERFHGQVPRTLDEVANSSRVGRKEIGRTYRFMTRELKLKLMPTRPQDYVSRFCSELKLSGEVQAKAADILKDAAKKELTSGRGPTGVAAAAIYISSILCNERRTQREVADVAGVTEVTIRNRYKELTEKLGIEVQL